MTRTWTAAPFVAAALACTPTGWAWGDTYQTFQNHGVRLGLGVGTVPDGGLSLMVDKANLLAPGWSFGGELMGAGHNSFFLAARFFYWEYKNSLNGFFGGPKAYLIASNHPSVGVGGEGGWLWRFPFRMDLGGSVEVMAAPWNFWATVKFNIGVLL